jgi:anti-sigma B factor antagonist
LILDLAQVSFLGSRGLAMIVAAGRAARAASADLRGVTGPGNRAVLRPLEITGVIDTINWAPTAPT